MKKEHQKQLLHVVLQLLKPTHNKEYNVYVKQVFLFIQWHPRVAWGL